MKFSVIIPTYNRRDLLSRTLAALFSQEFPSNGFEVVVAVDGSTDGTLEMLQNLRPRCGFQFFRQPNRGLPAARNLGLQAAHGDLVLILDDDIICDPLLLKRHLEAHSVGDNLVVFGPVPLHPDSPPGLAAERWRTYADQFQMRVEASQGSGSFSALWLAASAPAVNRSIARTLLVSLGGCDEALRDCHEDWDLGIRLWKAGARFHFQPAAVAYHLFTKSDRDIVQNDAGAYARGEVALSRKHREYRPLSGLAAIGGESWSRILPRAVVALPFSIEAILRPLFLFLNALRRIPAIGRAGSRLLNYRCSFEVFREAARVTGSRKALKAEFGMRLPVLAYHHVGEARPGTYPDLSVTPQRLERHIRWLHERGYRSVMLADWIRWSREGTGLPEKPVLLTFDDAFADIGRYALPLLRRYGFSAVVFVVTGQIGASNQWDKERGSAIYDIMTAEQIRYWDTQGVEFGAHSRTHPDLASLSAEAAAKEIAGSGDDLASLLGHRVSAFAYPYGRHNAVARDSARAAYELAFTTDMGLNDLGTDLFCLRRTCVGHRDSVLSLERFLRSGTRPPQQSGTALRIRRRLRHAAQWAFG